MINIKAYIENIAPTEVKLPVPQVGTYTIDYALLSDLKQNYFYDFIVNNNGDLLIGKGHYKLNNKQDTLLFAGRLKVEMGKIIYIDNDSGHYIPNKESLYHFYDIMKQLSLVSLKKTKDEIINPLRLV